MIGNDHIFFLVRFFRSGLGLEYIEIKGDRVS